MRYGRRLWPRLVGEDATILGVSDGRNNGAADFINGTTIEIDGGMLPGVLYEAGLKTITDLL